MSIFYEVDKFHALFDLILYIPVNFISVISGRVFLGQTSTKQGYMCLAQGHTAVMPVRPEPASPRSRVQHSTTEPLRSPINFMLSLVEHGTSFITVPLADFLVSSKQQVHIIISRNYAV